jgi:predicted nuclease of predicted toxin-antitoxin system
VRVKVDENLPASVASLLRERGFEADTVIEEGLAGAIDDDLLAAAREGDRMIVTLDRGFGDIRRYPLGSHPGIVVLRLADESALATRAAIMQLLDTMISRTWPARSQSSSTARFGSGVPRRSAATRQLLIGASLTTLTSACQCDFRCVRPHHVEACRLVPHNECRRIRLDVTPAVTPGQLHHTGSTREFSARPTRQRNPSRSAMCCLRTFRTARTWIRVGL